MAAKRVTKIDPIPTFNYLKSPNDIKKRVAAYARVSTDSDEQETSLVAQIDYYKNFINKRDDWLFVGVYHDDGISGISTRNRSGFKKMIRDAQDGKIDLILTKSLSRFARNTVDTLVTIRKLKEIGVEVYFEKEDIYTFDSKGEFLITIMSSLAQEESRNISENVAWGVRKRFADGKYHIACKTFLGFERDEEGEIQINKDEALVVKFIFLQHLKGDAPSTIKNHVEKLGLLTATGKEVWSESTIVSILQNEKYKGDALLQKRYTADFLTKKQKINKGELPQYYVTDGHPPIITNEIFALTQEEFERRKDDGGRYTSKNALSGKIICPVCDCYYGRKVMSSTSKYRALFWKCNGFYKNECNSWPIRDDKLQEFCSASMEHLFDEYESVKKSCERILKEADINLSVDLKEAFDSYNEATWQMLIKEIKVCREGYVEITFINDESIRFEYYHNDYGTDAKSKKLDTEMVKIEKAKKMDNLELIGADDFPVFQNTKENIAMLAHAGFGYRKIAKMIGATEGMVKSYCYRHKLRVKDIPTPIDVVSCKYCGMAVVQTPHKKKKEFCDDKCRMKWNYNKRKKEAVDERTDT